MGKDHFKDYYAPWPPSMADTSYAATGEEHEETVEDPVTGGKKGVKRAQLGSLDPMALYTVAEVAGSGAMKYDRNNYLKGYAWSLSYDAMMRHMLKFWAGEDTDEDGLPHVGHAVWHGLALLAFSQRDIGTDDRPKR